MLIKKCISLALASFLTVSFTAAHAEVCPGTLSTSPYSNTVISILNWDGKVPEGWGFTATEIAKPGPYAFFFAAREADQKPGVPGLITCVYIGEGSKNIITLSKESAIPGWNDTMCGNSTGATVPTSYCPFTVISHNKS